MLIRDYQGSDFPRLEFLWKETGIFREERGDTPESIAQCQTMGGRLLVMEDPENQSIIASSWLTFDGRRLLMHHFAVLPSYQNKGYGRALALASLDYAKEKKIPVKIEVHKDNTGALSLYKSLGFEPLEGYGVYMKYPS